MTAGTPLNTIDARCAQVEGNHAVAGAGSGFAWSFLKGCCQCEKPPPEYRPLLSWRDNTAHSNGAHGLSSTIYVPQGGTEASGLVAWRNAGWGFMAPLLYSVRLSGFRVAQNGRGGIYIGDITTLRHMGEPGLAVAQWGGVAVHGALFAAEAIGLFMPQGHFFEVSDSTFAVQRAFLTHRHAHRQNWQWQPHAARRRCGCRLWSLPDAM